MNTSETINILGVNINMLDMNLAFETAKKFLESDDFHCIYTPNSEIVMSAYKNPEFCEVINKADIKTADGIGLVYAARIQGTPLKERVAGFDLVMKLLSALPELGKTVYFFGGAPGVAEEAKEKLEKMYPGINICGTSNGYFDETREKEIISEINEKKPDLLLVCLGSPKQENWINVHRNELSCRLAMGVGGTLDVIAGRVQRAPQIFINLGLEWFYRLLKQPSRFIRMMALPEFLLTVIGKKLFHKKEKNYNA